MSAKVTQGLSIGIVGLLVFGIIMLGFLLSSAEEQSRENFKHIKLMEKDFDEFKKEFQERQIVGNQRANITLNEINQIEKDVLGNLTGHRLVTNDTFAYITKLINQTSALTGPEYEELADKRVENIVKWTVGNLTENSNQQQFTPPGWLKNEPQGPKVK